MPEKTQPVEIKKAITLGIYIAIGFWIASLLLALCAAMLFADFVL